MPTEYFCGQFYILLKLDNFFIICYNVGENTRRGYTGKVKYYEKDY